MLVARLRLRAPLPQLVCRLPALVRIEQGQVSESREFGVEEGGACGRGGEQAQSSALPPLTPAALQQAVQAMLP